MTPLYKTIIHQIITATLHFEDKVIPELFSLTDTINQQGYLTKEQAIKILKWKSPRPLKHYNKNSNQDFRQIKPLAFRQSDEKIKIHILKALTGVKYPATSVFLMFQVQTKYPIIDIRVWKQLYKNRLLNDNPSGQRFTLRQRETSLNVLSEDQRALYVISESKTYIKPWVLVEIIFENALYVHTSLGSYFSPEGVEKQYCLAQDIEWHGGNSIDD